MSDKKYTITQYGDHKDILEDGNDIGVKGAVDKLNDLEDKLRDACTIKEGGITHQTYEHPDNPFRKMYEELENCPEYIATLKKLKIECTIYQKQEEVIVELKVANRLLTEVTEKDGKAIERLRGSLDKERARIENLEAELIEQKKQLKVKSAALYLLSLKQVGPPAPSDDKLKLGSRCPDCGCTGAHYCTGKRTNGDSVWPPATDSGE